MAVMPGDMAYNVCENATWVMGAPDCLAVSAATRLQSLLRSRLSNSIFCSRDSASSGASVPFHPPFMILPCHRCLIS